MDKTVFLYVSGDGDYNALDFERNFNAQQVYQDMLNENVSKKVFDTDDYYIVVQIKEFRAVDPEFISFVKNNLCDYDALKAEDIFEVNIR